MAEHGQGTESTLANEDPELVRHASFSDDEYDGWQTRAVKEYGHKPWETPAWRARCAARRANRELNPTYDDEFVWWLEVDCR